MKQSLAILAISITCTAMADPILPDISGRLFTQKPLDIDNHIFNICPLMSSSGLCNETLSGISNTISYSISTSIQLDNSWSPTIAASAQVATGRPTNGFISGAGVQYSYAFLAAGPAGVVAVDMPLAYEFHGQVTQGIDAGIAYSQGHIDWKLAKNGFSSQSIYSVNLCTTRANPCHSEFGLNTEHLFVEANKVYILSVEASMAAATYNIIPLLNTSYPNIASNSATLFANQTLEIVGFTPLDSISESRFLPNSGAKSAHTLYFSAGVNNIPSPIPSVPEQNTTTLLLSGLAIFGIGSAYRRSSQQSLLKCDPTLDKC